MVVHYPNKDNTGPVCGDDLAPYDSLTYDVEYLDCQQCIYATCVSH